MALELFAEACREYGGEVVESGGTPECIVSVGPGELFASLERIARLASLAGVAAEIAGRPVAVTVEVPMEPEYGVVRVVALPEGGYRLSVRLYSEASVPGLRSGEREERVAMIAGVPVRIEAYPRYSPRERATWAAVEASALAPSLTVLAWLYEHLAQELPRIAGRYLERVGGRRRRRIPLPI